MTTFDVVVLSLNIAQILLLFKVSYKIGLYDSEIKNIKHQLYIKREI